MAIDISAIGGLGTHSFRRTNVNTAEDFIYYRNDDVSSIPVEFALDATFIYTDGIGRLAGIDNGDLLYVTTFQPKKLTFSATSGGNPVNITEATTGSVKFNKPIVFGNKLNIDASTPTNQAVKYFTDGTPLTGLTSGSTYFLKNVSISDFAGTQGLYDFSSHTFTTCGRTGREGPTQNQMRAAYTTIWDETYLSQGDFQGYQDWTVPVSGVYEFTAAGASGFNGAGPNAAGRGAIVKGRVSLTKGEIITITVGQVGEAQTGGSGTYGGSGGGTFIVRKSSNDPLLVAGGGTADTTLAGQDGVLAQLGGASSGGRLADSDEGFGGVAANGFSAAGGGFFSRGQDRTFIPANGGGSFLDGLTMAANSSSGGAGGFGGGGQSDGNRVGQAAGAGGYSGGAGGRNTTSNTRGGGGGSFISASITDVATSTGLFDGIDTFNGAPITNLNSYNTGEGSVGVTLVSDFTTGNEVYPTATDANAGTNKIAVEPAGSSYHAIVPINFDIDNDTIHSATPHTLTNGEAITPTFRGTPPNGLTSASIYYVEVVDLYSYKLSLTPSPSFTTINLTQPAGLSETGSDFVSRVVVNTATNTLTITNHGFLVDQPLQYNKGGDENTVITPLQDGATYYVAQVVNANQITLKVALDAPSPISFTATGTGTAREDKP